MRFHVFKPLVGISYLFFFLFLKKKSQNSVSLTATYHNDMGIFMHPLSTICHLLSQLTEPCKF